MARAPREGVRTRGSRSCLLGVPAPRPVLTATSDTLGTWGSKLCYAVAAFDCKEVIQPCGNEQPQEGCPGELANFVPPHLSS